MSVILNFITLLRFFGLPVSPSETITAQQSYEILGVDDKFNLMVGLKSSIIKRHEDSTIFEICFQKYFGSKIDSETKEIPNIDQAKNNYLNQLRTTSTNEINSIAENIVNNHSGEAIEQVRNMFALQEGFGAGMSFGELASDLQNQLTRSLYRTFNIQVPIRGLTPVQRSQLQPEVVAIITDLQLFFQKLQSDINRDLKEQERIQDVNVIDMPEDLFNVNNFLLEDLTTVSSTMKNVKEQLLEIGKILASRERRRRKNAKEGKLDFRRTMRKNLKNNGIPVELVQKRKRIQDPEIIILNDVSGSTRWIADWFFVITYTAQQVYKKIRVYEFDNTTVDVSTALKHKTIEHALEDREQIWKKPVRSRRIHSDYQDSFEDFFTLIKYRPINRRTTILILGDCRDYEGMWEHDRPISSIYIRKMVQLAKNVIILNPESETLWDAGDSIVKYFQSAGAQVFHVATLKDLLTFVFRLKNV
ncbi:MAG: VWA domain-containing protein [Candidatus Hodarchaeales archaeon]|jgi:uncharacterized protein with von Willebrand factor type A (vWA) domain